MIFYDLAIFTCPACQERIEVSSIEGQEFYKRIEQPKEFNCPKCNATLIFSSITRITFYLWAAISFVIAPIAFLLSPNSSLAIALMVLGMFIFIVGLLLQRIEVVEKSFLKRLQSDEALKITKTYPLANCKTKYEFIFSGEKEMAIESLLNLLHNECQLQLYDNRDSRDGETSIKFEAQNYFVKSGGNGFETEWKAIDRNAVCTTIRQLYIFNSGKENQHHGYILMNN